MIPALRLVQRNALVYRHVWRGSLFSSFLQPLLYLTAMGVGLGSLIDAGGGLGGAATYIQFLAPGLLAAACMQTATFESSYPIMDRMTWHRNYEAITATPMRAVDVVLGELAWVAVRLCTVATAFVLVMLAFGVARTPLAVLAIPAAVLTGLAFAAPIMAYAVTLKNGNRFNVVFRFVITPLFLFSGVFFPVTRLPEWIQPLAWATPLFHGVALTRGLTLDRLPAPAPDGVEWAAAIAHLAYLVAVIGAGGAAGVRTFTRKLRP